MRLDGTLGRLSPRRSARDRIGQKQAKIERLSVEARLTAGQAMIRRQRPASGCQAQ